MMTARAALIAATRRLRQAGVPDPARDARHLLAHAMGVERTRLALILPEGMPQAACVIFGKAIRRRAQRQPVSQITGRRAFYGRKFAVTPDVLDPRPETELLVEAARAKGGRRILDLGTGSGAILVTCLAEMPRATGVGVDVSDAALKVARANAQRHAIADRAQFVLSDWFAGVKGRFDLIVSNPPYIPAAEMHGLSPEVALWEPGIALTTGGDGLDACRAIVARAGEFLEPGGWLIAEIGMAQGAAVSALFAGSGFDRVSVAKDMDGRNRLVSGQVR